MTNSKPRSARVRAGVMSLCLMLSLTACALRPVAPTPALPPSDLYDRPVNVPEPPQGALDNAGLSKYALSLIEALGLANADRAAIGAWASTIQKEN